MTKLKMGQNPRPNITRYQVCMEDGGGNGGKSGFRQRTTKYYQFWKFGDGRFKHFDLGTTSANSCFYPRTAVSRAAIYLSKLGQLKKKYLYIWSWTSQTTLNSLNSLTYINMAENTLF